MEGKNRGWHTEEKKNSKLNIKQEEKQISHTIKKERRVNSIKGAARTRLSWERKNIEKSAILNIPQPILKKEVKLNII